MESMDTRKLLKEVRSQMQKQEEEEFLDHSFSDEDYHVNEPVDSKAIGSIMNSLDRFAISDSNMNQISRKFKSVQNRGSSSSSNKNTLDPSMR